MRKLGSILVALVAVPLLALRRASEPEQPAPAEPEQDEPLAPLRLCTACESYLVPSDAEPCMSCRAGTASYTTQLRATGQRLDLTAPEFRPMFRPRPAGEPAAPAEVLGYYGKALELAGRKIGALREENATLRASRNRANADAAELERKLAAEQRRAARLEEALKIVSEAFTRAVPALQVG